MFKTLKVNTGGLTQRVSHLCCFQGSGRFPGVLKLEIVFMDLHLAEF